MKQRALAFLSSTSAAALVVALTGCGGDSPITPTSSPTPPPCTQAVVYQDQGKVPTRTVAVLPFATSVTARLDVVVDWTHADSHVAVYVVPLNSCDLAKFNARTCNFLIQSENGAKPRKLSASAVAAGSYDLLIANFAARDEAVSTQVISSTSTCPAIAGESEPNADANPEEVESLARR